MSTIPALTLTQPWATLVALGAKRIETRSWSTSYRGLIAVHAAKGFPRRAKDFAAEELALGRLPARIPLGQIVATARLVDTQRTEEIVQEITALERRYGDYSYGRFAWLLGDVKALDEPIPTVGHQGLWRCDLPSELVVAVLA